MAKLSEIFAKLMGTGIITVDEAGQKTISKTPEVEDVEVEGLSIFEPIVEDTVVETKPTELEISMDIVSREELSSIINRLIKLEQLVIAVDEVNNIDNKDKVEVW